MEQDGLLKSTKLTFIFGENRALHFKYETLIKYHFYEGRCVNTGSLPKSWVILNNITNYISFKNNLAFCQVKGVRQYRITSKELGLV